MRNDLKTVDRQIAQLVEQLERGKEIIAQLQEDHHRLRRELLAVQERKLRAMRCEDAELAEALA